MRIPVKQDVGYQFGQVVLTADQKRKAKARKAKLLAALRERGETGFREEWERTVEPHICGQEPAE